MIGNRPWGHLAGGLVLSLFINFFALFGLFFIDNPRERKFFVCGVCIGTFGAVIILAILVAVGFTLGGIAAIFASTKKA